jgi:3-phytase
VIYRAIAAVLPVLAASACQGGEDTAPASETQTPVDEVVLVSERWVSEADTLWDVDTPGAWTDGKSGMVLVTGKATHDLRVFDAATGATMKPVGREGSGAGEFLRPNGLKVVGDVVLVVERDNRRVQVLSLPDGTPLGSFGEDVLEYPYGIATEERTDALTVWVTDDYEYEEDVVPDDLTHRLHRFRVRLVAGQEPVVEEHAAFGAPRGPGALRVVESIEVDPEAGRLLVADESRKSYLAYDTNGEYQGRALAEGRIEGDPEGIVLVGCTGGGGYWVVTDQQDDVSLFRVFDRESLEYVGTFRGAVTANTDGTTFEHGPVPGFAAGVLYAVHDDKALSAFDWADVTGAMGLRDGCGRESG